MYMIGRDHFLILKIHYTQNNNSINLIIIFVYRGTFKVLFH